MNNKFVLVPVELLKNLKELSKGTEYEDDVRKVLDSREAIENHDVTKLPKTAVVKRVIDGDTVELFNGTVLRYVGITAPEESEDFAEEASKLNKELVEGKEIKLEYDNYTSDKFGRILAYPIIDEKNISIELVRKGMAELVIYQKRKPFIYQVQLLEAQEQAKSKKLGIWKNS
ncbi:MAG: thermonuclease family protein [bacterium]|nr:MAG: thermonuclease family protein [bacterium]